MKQAANRHDFKIGLAFAAVTLGVFFVVEVIGWTGEPATCLDEAHGFCYGERPRTDSMIQQPSCTWSNLAFVFAGLWILWRLGERSGQASGHPMISRSAAGLGYGLIAIFIGPGSMFFHAALTKWGQWVDQFSMHLLTSWLIAFGIARLWKLGRGGFLMVS